MATFIVFWAAILAIVCFGISSVLKGILAILQGIGQTIADVFVGLFFGGGAAFLLYLLASAVKAIMEGTFWSAIGSIILTIIVGAFLIGLVGELGAVILSIIAGIAVWAMSIILVVFEWLYDLFENGYAHFLRVIMIRLELIESESTDVSEG